jgi:hypothetical protein
MILGRGGTPEGETPSGETPLNFGYCEQLFEGLLGFFNLSLKGDLAFLAGIEAAFHDLFGRFGEEGIVIDQAEGDLLSLILKGTHGIAGSLKTVFVEIISFADKGCGFRHVAPPRLMLLLGCTPYFDILYNLFVLF